MCLLALFALVQVVPAVAQAVTAVEQSDKPTLSGRVITREKEEIPYATVRLKGTSYGCSTNEKGFYFLHAPAGEYTLVVSAIGYETVERPLTLTAERQKMNITLKDQNMQLDEVVVMATGVGRVKRSPFNAVAVDTREMLNTTKNLSVASPS